MMRNTVCGDVSSINLNYRASLPRYMGRSTRLACLAKPNLRMIVVWWRLGSELKSRGHEIARSATQRP